MMNYVPNWNAIFGPSVQAAGNQAVASQGVVDQRNANINRRRQGFRDFFGNLRQNTFNALHPNLAALGNTFQGATVTPYQQSNKPQPGGYGYEQSPQQLVAPAAPPPYFNGGLGTAWGQIPTSQRNQFLPGLVNGRRTYTPPQRVY